MNEEQIRKIVQEEMRKNYLSGTPKIPPHSHNGTDNLNINAIDVQGFYPLPSSPQKYMNPNGTYTYGFALPIGSSTSGMGGLVPADSAGAGQYIGNILSSSGTNTGTTAIYPIPVVVGNGAGLSGQGSFNGGWAPDGTLVLFTTGSKTTSFLYVRWDGQWFGVSLSATPVTP